MSNPVGQTLITADGINALEQAHGTGRSIKPKYFRFSDVSVSALDPMMSAADFNGWITRDISLYRQIADDTIEFVLDVEPTEAAYYAKLAGIFLDDGTLFAIAKPPFPFPPMLRQTFKIQLSYQNASELMDFRYLPHYETEQDLALLDVSVTLGLQTIENAREIGLLKSKLGAN
ncbi:hypothetical protein [Nitratifractor salsuginis]|uniref:Phage tail protein n=1 Tax=Nitratifractor salsuginis (strain DSM 16511 / JCM 12458 / E9I37-1) TaxID=749222 RepID=E6X1N2_NITSE|nr:hypothetical protein [Nitratifractor salsuginis]ADV47023.1 hypothetical protein Nitsa_1778 [Nitratifractor salsuginis DSM 16511]